MKTKLTCAERDAIVHEHGRYEGWTVWSSCTDLSAEFSDYPRMDITWTNGTRYIADVRHPGSLEWDVPVTPKVDRLPCEHYELDDQDVRDD